MPAPILFLHFMSGKIMSAFTLGADVGSGVGRSSPARTLRLTTGQDVSAVNPGVSSSSRANAASARSLAQCRLSPLRRSCGGRQKGFRLCCV